MIETTEPKLPRVVFFNINGNGIGHMSTCLAYANRMRDRARPVFFTLVSAVEMIHEMGFEADYFVSRFWSRATSWAWDRQLALRLGMFFERIRPEVVVFDGTWPYRGLLHAAKVYGVRRMVWSDLTLYKAGTREVPVSKDHFDLIIKLGELGSSFQPDHESQPTRKVTIPPFTLLKDDQLLDKNAARDELGLKHEGRYALISLGPGNLKDVSVIGHGLIDELMKRGYTVVWARAPISARDVQLPNSVIPIAVYPLVRVMRAFDLFIGAAGYNTCCEVLQSGVPTLFVPNTLVADDQMRRAKLVAEAIPAVVSPCESSKERARAVEALLSDVALSQSADRTFDLSGAEHAANEILALIEERPGDSI